jgi:hypothetical protein
MRYRILLLALAPLACATPSRGQKAPTPTPAGASDTTRAMSASLLRRLAEAVDGYRSGEALYVVAAWHFPHEVAGVFPSRALASEAVRRKGLDYAAFGPYFAPPDSGNELMVYSLRLCPGLHELDSYCPDTTASLSQAVPYASIKDVTITIHAKDGTAVESVLPPSEVDAVFFTLSAIDKFVMPYYTRIYGAQFAADMRAGYLRNLRALRK